MRGQILLFFAVSQLFGQHPFMQARFLFFGLLGEESKLEINSRALAKKRTRVYTRTRSKIRLPSQAMLSTCETRCVHTRNQ
jgi:hypothetical protein